MPQLIIDNQTIRHVSAEGNKLEMPLEQLLDALYPARPQTLGVVPSGVRMVESRGPKTIWVYEMPPTVRQLRWIRNDSPQPFGSEATYRSVTIALPYLVVLAAYEGTVLSDYNECFFRNAPLSSEDDELFYPALLNCSKFVPPEQKPLAWICTQKLDRRPILSEQNPKRQMLVGLNSLLRCLLENGFNFSSEKHEASSWFSESVGCDKRISTIENWEAATKKEGPLFVLDVPWLPTGYSVKQVVQRMFDNKGARDRKPSRVIDLIRVMLNHQRQDASGTGTPPPELAIPDLEEMFFGTKQVPVE